MLLNTRCLIVTFPTRAYHISYTFFKELLVKTGKIADVIYNQKINYTSQITNNPFRAKNTSVINFLKVQTFK
jgi:hypothetical protein